MPSVKTQEHAAVEKPSAKPGRKPLLSEPKNKRTAQNRAAQRAFRERKEKRMMDLEDKVRLLEQEKTQIANESELLRIQVKSLMKQLGKSPSEELDNIQLPASTVNTNEDDDSPSIRRSSLSDDRNTSSNSSVSSITPGSTASEDVYNFPKPTTLGGANSILGDTPSDTQSVTNTNSNLSLDLSNKLHNRSFKDHYDEHIFCKELSQVCGSSSCPMPIRKTPVSTSNSPSTVAGSTTNNNNNSSGNNLFTSTSSITSPSVVSSARSDNYKSPFADNLFDGSFSGEGGANAANVNIDAANNDLLFANSRRESKNNSIWNIGNGLDSYAFLDNNKNDEMNFLFDDNNKIQNDTNNLIQNKPEAFQFSATPNNFLDNGLDLDFDNDDVFDDLLKLPFDDINKPAVAAKQEPTAPAIPAEEDETVPDNTTNLMKCSQIWERITTHPRFTDLDIDNLCDELKQKAKCSESGVVVDGTDVGKLLHKATCDKQKQLEKSRETDIKLATMSRDATGFLSGLW